MRWQFGGNLQPVRMICEFDWKECPSAIINYVWSEIVTDVVECLTNEWMIWRVIAMLFVCSVLIHTIYSKTKLIDETTMNRKNLNVVGCKVQDLELKVNILTYKMQYGTWPLPRQIHGSGVERELRNVRLTLTNSNDRNAWIKHMLLSPSENASCVPYAKIGPRSVRCLTKLINLETKYMSSKFERDQSPMSTKGKTSRIGSEKSLGYVKTSGEIMAKDEEREKLGKSENLGMRNREILETSKKAANNCWSETQVSKYRENAKWTRNEMKKVSKKSCQVNKTPEERVNATHDTLHQVREKLENLHSVLRVYGQPTSQKNPANSTNQELAETILRELKNLGNFPESETDTKTQKSSICDKENGDSNSENVSKKEENPMAESTSEFEQCHSDPDFSSSSNYENCQVKNCHEKLEKVSKSSEATDVQKNLQKTGPLSNYENCPKVSENNGAASFQKGPEKESSSFDSGNCNGTIESVTIFQKNPPKQCSYEISENCHQKKSLEIPDNREPMGIPKKLHNEEKQNVDLAKSEKVEENHEKVIENWKIHENQISEEQTIPSPISSTAEFSKDSDTDEKSNASLLREALKFKNALMTQIELENSSKSVMSTRSDESESDETLWSKSKLHFQPKILDIISEEHSASSSTEKAIKVREKKNPLENSSTLKKIESSSSLKIVESQSSLKISSEKSSDSGENCSKIEKVEKEEKVDFPEEEKSGKEPARDLTSLVKESVQNIREYIEAFSQMQKEAIVETKMSLRDENNSYLKENPDFSFPIPEEKSSVDSITRFVNTVAITVSEELPRKLSEPAIMRLVDFEMENSEEDSSLEMRKVDLSLRRRPGSTSLAETAACEEKSIFESANSFDEYEDDFTTDFSCKQLNDYSSQSASDVANEKLLERDFEEKSRLMDSPLTGRTVIRATGSSTSNLEVSTNENESVKSFEYEKSENRSSERFVEPKVDHKLIDIEESIIPDSTDRFFQPEVIQETSSTYFTDQASFPDIGTQLLGTGDQKFEVEDDNWLYEREFPEKPEVELKSDDSVNKMEIGLENSENESKIEKIDDFFTAQPEMEHKKEFANGVERKETADRQEEPEVEQNSTNIRENTLKINQQVNMDEKNEEKHRNNDSSKEEPETNSENAGNRPNSSETFVINSPRTKSRTSDISNLFIDASTLYMDANSREFLNTSGTSLRLEKSFLGSSRSARGSCSSPLRQSVPWNTPRRGSSLTSSERSRRSSEKLEKPKESSKNVKNLGDSTKRKNSKVGTNGLATKSHLTLDGTKDLESSSFGRRIVNSNVDLRERRSRSYTTPRKSDSSPRNSTNGESIGTQRLSRDRKTQKCVKIDSENEKMLKEACQVVSEDSRECLRKKSPSNSSPNETQKLKKPEKSQNLNKNEKNQGKIDSDDSRGCLSKNSPSFPTSNETEKLKKSEKLESPSLSSSESRETAKLVKSTKSTSLLSKNMSKSSIPVLRSRLEAVRQTGQEKRSKSPSRCALTMSTSSWGQENRSLPIFSGFEKKNACPEAKTDLRTSETMIIDSQGLGAVEKVADSEMRKKTMLPESRTVIYVNIVTEQEHKSATRIVDPKKFLEYLKDRDLKIQSVQDQEIAVEKVENHSTSSPRILTIVSSAVEEKMGENSRDNSRPGGWSLRVEKREIEVSAKPSVIDTSTSISDLPDAIVQPRIPGDSKFQIFQVPKELTKDEYIVLLETLNQDPNLHQLREMHNLCNKLGLGFNE